MRKQVATTESSVSTISGNADDHIGSNYLGAMRIAVEMIDMSDSYDRVLQLLAHVADILHGDKIKTIFPPSE